MFFRTCFAYPVLSIINQRIEMHTLNVIGLLDHDADLQRQRARYGSRKLLKIPT